MSGSRTVAVAKRAAGVKTPFPSIGAKKSGIRHRLLTILSLGVVVSALTLAALIHLLSTTMRHRVERASEAVTEEVERLARDPRLHGETAPFSIVGMRGGTRTESGSDAYGKTPAEWVPAVEQAMRQSRLVGGPATLDVPIGDSTLVVAARPARNGAHAWSGFLVRPMSSLKVWQWIVTLLALATGVLVATTVYAIVTVQRGAAALRTALQGLATDLSAPIPRSNVQELSSIADGIQRMAERLARARREEERLQRELARQERLAALGRVAAGVAHEVRNPLASIKLRLDLAAAEHRALPPDVEKAISHATTEIGRLDRLVADLLIVAGRATGPRTSASLGTVVRARVEALSPWARERGVSVSASGDATVTADMDSVARSVDNLLRNAAEASPSGGSVTATVETRGDDIIVAVTDRGPGVSQEHASELFEPFFTTKPDGTGLGLALSRAIARAHGGDLSYVRDAETTRFELALPSGAKSEPKHSMEPSTSPDARDGAVA